jgi:hypothetical protein
MKVIIKYDEESYFLEFDKESNPISDIVWTGHKDLAKIFNSLDYTDNLTDTLEVLIEEGYLPLVVERVE